MHLNIAGIKSVMLDLERLTDVPPYSFAEFEDSLHGAAELARTSSRNVSHYLSTMDRASTRMIRTRNEGDSWEHILDGAMAVNHAPHRAAKSKFAIFLPGGSGKVLAVFLPPSFLALAEKRRFPLLFSCCVFAWTHDVIFRPLLASPLCCVRREWTIWLHFPSELLFCGLGWQGMGKKSARKQQGNISRSNTRARIGQEMGKKRARKQQENSKRKTNAAQRGQEQGQGMVKKRARKQQGKNQRGTVRARMGQE